MLGSTLITRLIMMAIFRPSLWKVIDAATRFVCRRQRAARLQRGEVHLMKMGLNPGVLWKSPLALAQRRDEQACTGLAGTKAAHKQWEAARAGVGQRRPPKPPLCGYQNCRNLRFPGGRPHRTPLLHKFYWVMAGKSIESSETYIFFFPSLFPPQLGSEQLETFVFVTRHQTLQSEPISGSFPPSF